MELDRPLSGVVADARWADVTARDRLGIRRFAEEVLRRLPELQHLSGGLPLLHPAEPLWLAGMLARRRPTAYFSPGFNPPLYSGVPLVITVHDILHLSFPGDTPLSKRAYYRFVLRPAVRRASAVLTPSEHSKRELLAWTAVPEQKVVVVGGAARSGFTPEGPRHSPGYPYLLYAGAQKEHKNLPALLQALARSTLPPEIRLVVTGQNDSGLGAVARQLALGERVVFAGRVSEEELPAIYRGATAVVLPSLGEGFGLPALEGMASAVPVLASNKAALPEVTGDAAVLVDPHDVDAMADGLWRIVFDDDVRRECRERGLRRAGDFSWDRTASRIRRVLEDAVFGRIPNPRVGTRP